MTRIAILNLLPDAAAAEKLASEASKLNFQKNGAQDNVQVEVVLYSHKSLQDGPDYIAKEIPSEVDTVSKMHNYIVRD